MGLDGNYRIHGSAYNLTFTYFWITIFDRIFAFIALPMIRLDEATEVFFKALKLVDANDPKMALFAAVHADRLQHYGRALKLVQVFHRKNPSEKLIPLTSFLSPNLFYSRSRNLKIQIVPPIAKIKLFHKSVTPIDISHLLPEARIPKLGTAALYII